MKCLGKDKAECMSDCLIVNAVAGLAVGLLLTDRVGKVVWMNRYAQRLLGAEMNECAGRLARLVFKSPPLAAFWQEALQAKDNLTAELMINWPHPTELKVSATRCLDSRGREIGRALLLCDITQERSIQLKLSQAVASRLLALTQSQLPSEPVAHLTQQELRMLRLLGQGLGNSEIARKTRISATTVRSHLKSLYRKLDIRSRSEAVGFAIRNNVV